MYYERKVSILQLEKKEKIPSVHNGIGKDYKHRKLWKQQNCNVNILITIARDKNGKMGTRLADLCTVFYGVLFLFIGQWGTVRDFFIDE